MKRLLSGLFFLTFGNFLFAQKLNFPELYSTLEMENFQLDTMLKKKQYRLMQKEEDSTGSLIYYSSLERKDDGPSWVRSISVMEARMGNFSSKMFKYRIYDASEYRELMAWLLQENFTSTESFRYPDAIHTTYKNGDRMITVKVIDNKMKDGRIIKSYEFEGSQ